MREWTPRQFGAVLDDFKGECSEAAWKSLLRAYGVVRVFGKMSPENVAKKLANGRGIWELIGSAGNEKPRPLFYFQDHRHEIVFVHAFVKRGGSKDYKRAIPLAQKRRDQIERGQKLANVIEAFQASKPRVH